MFCSNMFIVDCETTGLLRSSLLLEVGGVVVNSNLEVLETFEIIINHSEADIVANCNDKVLKMHKESGLYEAVINSKISLQEAKSVFFEIVTRHTIQETKPILTNNTVRMDYMWLEENFKEDFVNIFDYRTIDISSINELVKRFCPEKLEQMPKKNNKHTAQADALETLEELRQYKKLLFNSL